MCVCMCVYVCMHVCICVCLLLPSSFPSAIPTMRLSQDSSRLHFFLIALPVLVVFGYFPLQVLPDIVRPDSSCKSFLVSCQAVTNPLLVGQGGRWVLKDLSRPKVSFQHLPSALASFSGFLVSLSTLRSTLGGSSANGLHP